MCNFNVADIDESLARTMTDRYIDEEGNERIDMLLEELVPEAANEIDWEDPNDPYALKAEAKLRKAVKRQREEEIEEQAKAAQAERNLGFTRTELDDYIAYRSQGLAPKSLDWINRASKALWDCTHGEISEKTMTGLRTFVLEKYATVDSHRKALGFAVAFLKRLSTTRAEPLFNSFAVYLELPKTIKVRNTVTERILRRDDIVEVLKRIDVAKTKGNLKAFKARNYRAFALLASYTGLRPSTIQRLTVGQFRAALKDDKPALHVLAEQEKNRVEH